MIKVISLKRSSARKKIFIENNPNINFTFFDAVDGAKLSQQFLNNSGLFVGPLHYTKGAYGCALSHLAIWEESINTKKIITVLEDDAILRHDFDQQHQKMIDSLKNDWDIILWGWNFDHILSVNIMSNISPVIMLFNQQQLQNSISEFQKSTIENRLMPLDKCFGIPAYSISPNGAKKFKDECFPLFPFEIEFPLMNHKMVNNGIDIAMNHLYLTSKSYACFPPLAVTKNEHASSTVQNAIYF